MRTLDSESISELREALKGGSPQQALPKIVGARVLAAGLWRFFSDTYPPGGVLTWNSPDLWRQTWPEVALENFFFGEDLWGNQLALRPQSERVWLWNHETGSFVDLVLDAPTLLEAVMQSGLEWMDFYPAEALAVGHARQLDVPESCHLHWTQPLILGGSATVQNTSVVERVAHLKGHGELWAQIRGLPLGSSIVTKRRTEP